MARLDFGQQRQIRELVSELTIQRASAALETVADWDAGVDKLLILGALEGVCDMRAQHFGAGDPDFHSFSDLSENAGELIQKTRLRLLNSTRKEDAAAGGPDRYLKLLERPDVLAMLAFPREVEARRSLIA